MAGTLATVLYASADRDDHARSCLLALGFGALGLLAFLVYLFGGPVECAMLAIRLGTFGLLLPIFFTVTHRHAAVLQRQRGAALHGGASALEPAGGVGVAAGASAAGLAWCAGWLWLVDIPLALVFGWHALAWQPWKARRPGR